MALLLQLVEAEGTMAQVQSPCSAVREVLMEFTPSASKY